MTLKKRLTVEVEDKRELDEIQAALDNPEARSMVRILGVMSELDTAGKAELARGMAPLRDVMRRPGGSS